MGDTSETSNRKWLSFIVITVSGIGILIISIVVIWTASPDDKAKQGAMVFSALLPLFGTWVGTVMAYYFSKDNFESAAKTTQDLLSKADQKLHKTSVQEAMKPFASITGVTIDAGKTDADVKFTDLRAKFTDKITRVPVFSAQKQIVYLIHDTALYRFAFKVTEKGEKLADKTLHDVVSDDDLKELAVLYAVVGPDATLADAKAKMEALTTPTTHARCQDVLVTSNGDNSGAVLGWITNTTIAQWSTV